VGSLLGIGLANALFACVLALAAVLAGRFSRRPALVHSLWLLVLLKLVTPPVWVPVPWLEAPQVKNQGVDAPRLPVSDPVSRDVVVAMAEPRNTTPAPALPQPPVRRMRIEDIAKGAPAMPGNDLVIPGPGMAIPGVAPPEASPPPPPEMEPQPTTMPAAMPEPLQTSASAPAPSIPAQGPEWRWPDLASLLACVWLCGALVYFFRVAYRLAQFQLLLCHAERATASLREEAEELAARVGLTRCPSIWLVNGPLPPLLWAAGIKPRMFFPKALLGQLDDRGRRSLLVHELAHLARRDHWVRWVELVVAGLYWWYPLVWLACRRLQAAEEECCDAWVVSTLPGHGTALPVPCSKR
jgi:beta-lactamase regulating signal transducer with metallopeptidase domain